MKKTTSKKGIPKKSEEKVTRDKENAADYERAVKGLFSRALEKAKQIHKKYSTPESDTEKTANSDPE